ncbi:hypothetical protein NPIL_351671 [Nephila pilipes]|uniref:Uncharacterized protein n=1 Tax=Nephila pilipes TaxID=299642 RepID=A0A8X6R1K0_NEPPI|nr:hypothetical protein NPIL_351671 [Nephila pilipes]
MDTERNACTFLWKIENFSCAWHRKGEKIESPLFVADDMERTEWRLLLYPGGDSNENFIAYYLKRYEYSKGSYSIEIDYELSFLVEDGTILQPSITSKNKFTKNQEKGASQFKTRAEIFSTKCLPEDTLTAYCRIWIRGRKNIGNTNIFARTVINVEKLFFVWSIENFSQMESSERKGYIIKSPFGEHLVTLELFLTGYCCEQLINICIKSYNPNVRYFRFNSFLFLTTGSRISCGLLEFRVNDLLEEGKLVILVTKKKLMEEKDIYLPNDVLSLNCECDFPIKITHMGTVRIERGIKSIISNFGNETSLEKRSSDTSIGLTDALRSLYSEGLFSDMKLRTATKTFSVHKNILSSRSVIFKAMFIREKRKEYIDIADMDADTMHRMLRYVYTNILDDLQWESACQLYVAADKYHISSLKNKCSTFLITNLTINNACTALVFSEKYQDKDFKNTVQNHILQNDKAIFCSSEWKKLMDTQPKLAAETMYLGYSKD